MRFQDGFMFTPEVISPHREKTPEGYLLCKGVTISRVGEFKYAGTDVPGVASSAGTVMLSRSEEELFSDTTIASFEGKPVVVSHARFADPTNWAEVAVGIVSNVHRGEGDRSQELVADLLLTKQEVIESVEGGKLREVSCGYDALTHDDGGGRGHQTGIVGNHVALVDKARCGSTCQIKDGTMDEEKLRSLVEAGDKEGLAAALSKLLNVKVDVAEEGGKSEGEGEKKPEPNDKPDPKDNDKKEEQKDGESEGDPKDASEEETADGDEDRIASLEKMVKELSEKVASLTKSGDGDEDAKKDEEDPDAQPATPQEVKETLQDADAICPGMKKPTGDAADGGFSVGALKRVKRMAIKSSGRPFKNVSSMDGDALNIAFKACADLARSSNNPAARMGDGQTNARVGINERNASFWKHNR